MKFGTSGVRGLVEDLPGGGAYIYAIGFARHMLNRGDLSAGDEDLVGQDYRPSSPAIADICCGALRAEGLVPIHRGAVTTPGLALFAASPDRSESFIPVDREAVSSQTLRLPKAWANHLELDAIVSADGDGADEHCLGLSPPFRAVRQRAGNALLW